MLSNSKTNILHNGVLRIRRVSMSDAGTWECRGTNAVGSATAVIHLVYLRTSLLVLCSSKSEVLQLLALAF